MPPGKNAAFQKISFTPVYARNRSHATRAHMLVSNLVSEYDYMSLITNIIILTIMKRRRIENLPSPFASSLYIKHANSNQYDAVLDVA